MTPLPTTLVSRMTFINRSATCCFPFSHRFIFFDSCFLFSVFFFFFTRIRNTKRTYLYSFSLRVPLLSHCICLSLSVCLCLSLTLSLVVYILLHMTLYRGHLILLPPASNLRNLAGNDTRRLHTA